MNAKIGNAIELSLYVRKIKYGLNGAEPLRRGFFQHELLAVATPGAVGAAKRTGRLVSDDDGLTWHNRHNDGLTWENRLTFYHYRPEQ